MPPFAEMVPPPDNLPAVSQTLPPDPPPPEVPKDGTPPSAEILPSTTNVPVTFRVIFPPPLPAEGELLLSPRPPPLPRLIGCDAEPYGVPPAAVPATAPYPP